MRHRKNAPQVAARKLRRLVGGKQPLVDALSKTASRSPRNERHPTNDQHPTNERRSKNDLVNPVPVKAGRANPPTRPAPVSRAPAKRRRAKTTLNVLSRVVKASVQSSLDQMKTATDVRADADADVGVAVEARKAANAKEPPERRPLQEQRPVLVRQEPRTMTGVAIVTNAAVLVTATTVAVDIAKQAADGVVAGAGSVVVVAVAVQVDVLHSVAVPVTTLVRQDAISAGRGQCCPVMKSSRVRSKLCSNCTRKATASCAIRRRTTSPRSPIRSFPVLSSKSTVCAKVR